MVIGFISSEVNFRDVPRKKQKRLRGDAAQLITCEMKKSIGLVLGRVLAGFRGAAWSDG